MPRISEKGQTASEFLIVIWGLLVIFFIVVKILIHVSNGHNDYNQIILRSAPTIEAESSPESIDLSNLNNDQYTLTSINSGCQDLYVSNGEVIKAGTEYSDPSVIIITYKGNGKYLICNSLDGASIDLLIAEVNKSE